MKQKVILHNSISVDGSLSFFEPNMELHYRIAGMFKPDVHLIGSNTITAGIALYGDGVPPENTSDFKKQQRDNTLPLWVLVDSTGKLEGILHTWRRFDMCRDVIVFVSQATPQRYLRYLMNDSTSTIALVDALLICEKHWSFYPCTLMRRQY